MPSKDINMPLPVFPEKPEVMFLCLLKGGPESMEKQSGPSISLSIFTYNMKTVYNNYLYNKDT